MTRPMPRFAAAAVLLIVLGTSGWLLFGTNGQLAFADLIEPIMEARSATFKITVEMKDQKPQTFNAMVQEPNKMRQEMHGGAVNICDLQEGKMVTLMPMQKMAIVINMQKMPKDQAPTNYFSELQGCLSEAEDNPDVKRESLGEKEFDGRKAIGYRITASAQTAVIWSDAKTALPIRVETTMKSFPDTKVIMSDFAFDVDLDPELFSLDIPKDYTVHESEVNPQPPTEEDLMELLGGCTELNDGRFLDTLDLKAVITVVSRECAMKIVEAGGPSADLTKEQLELMGKLSRGAVFVAQLPADADAHYAGKGVARDAADTPIFWYRPKDKTAYRVIYADLSVVEADAAPDVKGAEPLTQEATPQK